MVGHRLGTKGSTPINITVPPEDRVLGNRFFRKLTDQELVNWRSPKPLGFAHNKNVSDHEREMRRRSAVAGFTSVYDWMKHIRGQITSDNDSYMAYLVSIYPSNPSDHVQIIELYLVNYLNMRYNTYPVLLKSPHIHGQPHEISFPDLQYSYGIDIPVVSPMGYKGFHLYRWSK
jgi:hypothetical protein